MSVTEFLERTEVGRPILSGSNSMPEVGVSNFIKIKRAGQQHPFLSCLLIVDEMWPVTSYSSFHAFSPIVCFILKLGATVNPSIPRLFFSGILSCPWEEWLVPIYTVKTAQESKQSLAKCFVNKPHVQLSSFSGRLIFLYIDSVVRDSIPGWGRVWGSQERNGCTLFWNLWGWLARQLRRM